MGAYLCVQVSCYFRAASNVWNLQSIFEFVNIEASTIMSQLALRLLETGYKDDMDRLKRVSFRQFLPNTHLVSLSNVPISFIGSDR